jgi:hypothetical protein
LGEADRANWKPSLPLASHLDVASACLLLNGLVVKIIGTFKEPSGKAVDEFVLKFQKPM